MFWIGLVVALFATILGIGFIRTKVRHSYPQLSEHQLDAILFGFVVIGLLLSAWQKLTDDQTTSTLREELSRTETLAAPPTLRVYSTTTTKRHGRLVLHIKLVCSKNETLGQLQFLVTLAPDSRSTITDFWPSVEGGAFQSGPDSKIISADGRQARLIYSLMSAGSPVVDLEITQPTTVILTGNYMSGSNRIIASE